MEVKGNTHDLLFTLDEDPASTTSRTRLPTGRLFCTRPTSPGDLGFGDEIDRGLGRHGISNALFLYLRDPHQHQHQHQIELFTTHDQFIDLEDAPMCWTSPMLAGRSSGDARDAALILRGACAAGRLSLGYPCRHSMQDEGPASQSLQRESGPSWWR